MEFPAMVRAIFLVFAWVSCSPGAVTFALRLVVECGSTNALPPMSLEGGTQKFCLDQRPFAKETDVKSAAVTNEGKSPWVRLTLTEEASQRLLEGMRKNIGNRIAVVLDGRLIAVPLVRAPVSGPIPLTGPFTQQQANDIAAEFNHQAAHR